MKAQIINTYGDVKSVKPKNNKTFTLYPGERINKIEKAEENIGLNIIFLDCLP